MFAWALLEKYLFHQMAERILNKHHNNGISQFENMFVFFSFFDLSITLMEMCVNKSQIIRRDKNVQNMFGLMIEINQTTENLSLCLYY